MNNDDSSWARITLRRIWWVLFPCFTVLSGRLIQERACADPYDLLPGLTSNPLWAWPLAVMYVLAHVWTLAAYLVTVKRANTVIPAVHIVRTLWGRDTPKVFMMAAVLFLEHLPLSLWRMIGMSLRCQ
jgi:hypothetical protein